MVLEKVSTAVEAHKRRDRQGKAMRSGASYPVPSTADGEPTKYNDDTDGSETDILRGGKTPSAENMTSRNNQCSHDSSPHDLTAPVCQLAEATPHTSTFASSDFV